MRGEDLKEGTPKRHNVFKRDWTMCSRMNNFIDQSVFMDQHNWGPCDQVMPPDRHIETLYQFRASSKFLCECTWLLHPHSRTSEN